MGLNWCSDPESTEAEAKEGLPTFSRSVAKRVIEERIGVLGEDALSDRRFKFTMTA